MSVDMEIGTEVITFLPAIILTRFKEDDGEKSLIIAWLVFHFMISWGEN